MRFRADNMSAMLEKKTSRGGGGARGPGAKPQAACSLARGAAAPMARQGAKSGSFHCSRFVARRVTSAFDVVVGITTASRVSETIPSNPTIFETQTMDCRYLVMPLFLKAGGNFCFLKYSGMLRHRVLESFKGNNCRGAAGAVGAVLRPDQATTDA